MTTPTEDPAITALNAVLKPLGTNLRHYEAYAREPAIAAMRAVLEAERERCARQAQTASQNWIVSVGDVGDLIAKLRSLPALIAAAIRNPTPPSGD